MGTALHAMQLCVAPFVSPDRELVKRRMRFLTPGWLTAVRVMQLCVGCKVVRARLGRQAHRQNCYSMHAGVQQQLQKAWQTPPDSKLVGTDEAARMLASITV